MAEREGDQSKLEQKEPFKEKERTSVICQISEKCPHRCPKCYFYGQNETGQNVGVRPFGRIATTEEWIDLIDREVDPEKVNRIWWSGGEPLLNSDILTLSTHVKTHKPGIKILAKTTGTMLATGHPKVGGDYATALYMSGVDQLSISIDSYDPETHDRTQGRKGAHARTVEGIRRALEVPYLLVQTNTVIQPENMQTSEGVDHLVKTVDFLKGLGVHAVQLSPLMPYGRGENLYNSAREVGALGDEKARKVLENLRTVPGVFINMGTNYRNVRTYGPDLAVIEDDVKGGIISPGLPPISV